MYRELSQKETPPASTSTTGPLEGVAGVIEVASSNNTTQPREGLSIAPQYKVFWSHHQSCQYICIQYQLGSHLLTVIMTWKQRIIAIWLCIIT